MYEPVVLQKRQRRTITGTPAAKVFTVINLIKIVIPTIGVIWASDYVIKKRKLMAELDEFDFYNRKLTVREEFFIHEQFWSQPLLRDIAASVYKKYKDNNQLLEVGPGMISISELREEKK